MWMKLAHLEHLPKMVKISSNNIKRSQTWSEKNWNEKNLETIKRPTCK